MSDPKYSVGDTVWLAEFKNPSKPQGGMLSGTVEATRNFWAFTTEYFIRLEGHSDNYHSEEDLYATEGEAKKELLTVILPRIKAREQRIQKIQGEIDFLSGEISKMNEQMAVLLGEAG